MHDQTRRVPIWAMAAVGALLVGACGGDDDDDPTPDDDRETSNEDTGGGDDRQVASVAQFEDEIAVELAENANQPTPEVDCPDDLVQSEQDQLTCTGTTQNGDQFTIDVTWNDDEGRYDVYVPPEQFETTTP